MDAYIVTAMVKQCDECFQQLKDDAELATHLNQMHQKTYCGACRREFRTMEELNSHVKNFHGIIT
jgi:uncharacterized CHY-type Zn-finger protein